MIKVSRLQGDVFFVNPDLVMTLESTPDSILTLTTGDKYLIAESADVFCERFVAYKQQIHALSPTVSPNGLLPTLATEEVVVIDAPKRTRARRQKDSE